MMSKPTLLFYDPGQSAWVPKLKQLCAVQGLSLRLLEDGDLSLPLSALAQGSRSGAEAPPLPLPEPLFIFCGLRDGQLDRLLAALRRMEVPRSTLKAVLTPSNASWPVSRLYGELVRERAQLG